MRPERWAKGSYLTMKFQFQIMTGYAYGSQQPAVILHASEMPEQPTQFTANLARLIAHMPPLVSEHASKHGDAGLDEGDTLTLLIKALDQITLDCGDLRLTPVLWSNNGSTFQCFLPTLSPQLAVWVFQILVQNLENRDDPMSEETQDEFLKQIKKRARKLLPSGTNARSLIISASDRKMPFHIFDGKNVIFGYGSGSRIMNSSLTDAENVIGVRLAKNKATTNHYLGLSGFPVTNQIVVQKVEDIRNFTKTNGFPIVLKPTSEEQGRGVNTFITSNEEAEKKLKELSQTFGQIALERHYDGDGYRVYVLDGKVVWTGKLTAAQVIGDGVHTVRALIETVNASEERAAVDSVVKKIPMDDVVDEILAKQSLSLASVPDEGQKVLLSPTTNASRGGTFVPFNDELHPENVKLCEDIGKTMNLKCSGIDLISVDASKPWHENGAVICEVNAQPQIGFNARVELHDMLVDGLGVTPVPISIEVHAEGTEHDAPLFDRSRDRLHLRLSAQRVLNAGCPVQYFDELTFADNVPEKTRTRLTSMLRSTPLEDRHA